MRSFRNSQRIALEYNANEKASALTGASPHVVSNFKLSLRSRIALKLVHPDLVSVVTRAIEITTVDFIVTQGARTVAEQRHFVEIGASRTMNSRHLPANNESGLAEAIDVMPIVNGVLKDNLCPVVALAFYSAARELEVPLQWGGDWPYRWKDTNHFELKRGSRPSHSRKLRVS